jgi:arylsulfatase A
MADKPNIILIVADDMGYGDFGRFSGGRTDTPAIDRLCDEGVCLTQHYSGSAVCAPARAALLCGKYPHRTGAIDTLDARGLDRIALREKTLGDLMKAGGYATGLVGKWHSGAFSPKYHPNARGFDEFAGFRGGWQDYYRWNLDRNGSIHPTDGQYLTDVLTDEAIEFIGRHRDEPFFLHLAYNAPHFPLQCPPEDLFPYASTGQYNLGVSIVYGMIRRMDAGIARLMETLDDFGLTDDTLVMFTSDNGPQFGGNGEWNTTRYNCGYNGCKGNVYEGGIRVPMVLRWPGGMERTGAIDSMVHYVDWLPTLAAVVGAEVPLEWDVDGVNVLPALRGEADRVCTKRFWQWNRYTPLIESNAAMRDGRWKLVRPGIRETLQLVEGEGDRDRRSKYHPEEFEEIVREEMPCVEVTDPPAPQLFDLQADPGEQNDLADAEPERTVKMTRELETWFERVEADRASITD